MLARAGRRGVPPVSPLAGASRSPCFAPR
jgi:hypothetical protein